MKSFYKILYSNQEIINQRRTRWFFALIIFFVSVLMIATPFVTARLVETPDQLGQQFPNLSTGLIEVFEEFDCEVNQQQLNCDQPFTEKEIDGITYYINAKENQALDVPNEYVLFSDQRIILYNPNANISGDYSLLEGNSFDDLLALRTQENIDDQTLVNHFIQNVSQSTLNTQIPIIYMSVFIQYIIYVLLISLVFMAINANRFRNKISFKEMLTMMVLAMFSPALLSAIVGLVNPLWGTALFPLVYMARVIFVYFKLLKGSSFREVE